MILVLQPVQFESTPLSGFRASGFLVRAYLCIHFPKVGLAQYAHTAYGVVSSVRDAVEFGSTL